MAATTCAGIQLSVMINEISLKEKSLISVDSSKIKVK
jgi:hypothetical protein